MVDSRLFNSIQSPSHCLSLSHLLPQENSTLAYAPEDIVMHSLYAKITFVNALLFPDVYFVSFNNCVFIVSSVAIGQAIRFAFVICYLIKKR